MKILILVFLISCAKEIPKKIEGSRISRPRLDRLETEGRYTEKIDVMVAFLWPKSIITEAQRKSVRSIISNSRTLKDLQESYFKKKLALARAWKEKDCECILNGLCEEESTETPIEACEEIESGTYENERALPEIYEIVEKMKDSVRDSGGEWLKTHTDFPEGPVSEIDLKESLLKLSVFAPMGTPQDIPHIPFSLHRTASYDGLKASFIDVEGRGVWRLDLAIQRTAEAMKFQGKVILQLGRARREGIIYWMNPVRL